MHGSHWKKNNCDCEWWRNKERYESNLQVYDSWNQRV